MVSAWLLRLPIVRVGATICIHTCVVSIRLFWRGKSISCLHEVEGRGLGPDLVITHVGFGNGLYIRDAFPKARKIGFFGGITTVLTRMLISYSQGPLVGIKHFGCAPGMRRP